MAVIVAGLAVSVASVGIETPAMSHRLHAGESHHDQVHRDDSKTRHFHFLELRPRVSDCHRIILENASSSYGLLRGARLLQGL